MPGFCIVSVEAPHLAWDVRGAATGSPVQLYPVHGGPNQLFEVVGGRLVPSHAPPPLALTAGPPPLRPRVEGRRPSSRKCRIPAPLAVAGRRMVSRGIIALPDNRSVDFPRHSARHRHHDGVHRRCRTGSPFLPGPFLPQLAELRLRLKCGDGCRTSVANRRRERLVDVIGRHRNLLKL